MKEKRYQIELTEQQLRDLNYACDIVSRLRCGQMRTACQDIIEEAYERNDHKEIDDAWFDMRHRIEQLLDEIKSIGWKMPSNADYGVKYDDMADRLYDMHQVIRNALYWEKHAGETTHISVDGDTPMQFGDEPLIKIKKT